MSDNTKLILIITVAYVAIVISILAMAYSVYHW